eukprot:TRINITY_DN2380_c0_g1_i7.p1 TRINITY_DN2380_c0_g1~~TRINITY_DN2380_c0_g1_i7.p1  ORF type:complete len:469 (-),score=115.30 TRINITY_DN2380_c0_g1_i7:45-1328(-)
MAEHAANVSHCLAIGYGDLSFWCFKCESYIDGPELAAVYDAFCVAKFGEAGPSPATPADVAALSAVLDTTHISAPEAKISDAPEPAATISIESAPASAPTPAATTAAAPAPSMFQSMVDRLQGIAPPPPTHVLDTVDLEGVARAILSGRVKKIIVMAGAGISVSCGIPDFRSPGTGLYSNLAKYNLPYPEAIFELDFFLRDPQPFCTLAKELFPGNYSPSPTHYFLKLLADKGLLTRCYTQNIDGLERMAGVPADLVVEAHGTFLSSHCLRCRHEHPTSFVKDEITADRVPQCLREGCGGLVKPDIVFFGESLPKRFFQLFERDFPQAELLLVMGTSLKVQPFASLVCNVNDECPRVLINREKVGNRVANNRLFRLFDEDGFNFDGPDNFRDVFVQGDCDAGVRQFAQILGWEADLDALIQAARSHL